MNIIDHTILLVSCIFEIYICKKFVTSFYQKRKRNSILEELVFDFICVALLYILNLFGIANLTLALSPIILMAYIKIISEINFVHALMSFFVVFTALFGGELIFVVLANITSANSGLNLSEMPWMTFFSKLISYIILIFIIQVSGKSKRKIDNKIFSMYLLIPISSIGMMLNVFFIAQDKLAQFTVKFSLSFSFLLMLLGNIIVFEAFLKYGEQLQKNLEQAWVISRENMNRDYYLKIKQLNEKHQTLMHDLKQYVRTTCLLINKGNDPEALSILENLSSKITKNEIKVYSNNPQLDALISDKANFAEEKEISFTVNVEPVVKFDNIEMSDYIIMVGNLLDNALQATEKCTNEKEVILNLFVSENRQFLVCKISNTFNPAFLKMKNGTLISTKKEKGVHGLGIKSVAETASANNGYFLSKTEDNSFISILALPI